MTNHVTRCAVGAVLACALVASCDKGEAPTKFRDYSADELAGLEARLMQRIAANEQRHCIRPLLHATDASAEGPATADQLALLEPQPPFDACFPRGHHPRDVLYELPKLGTRVDHRSAQFDALVRDCAVPIADHLRAAISHRDACSPYQSGIRTPPDYTQTSTVSLFGDQLRQAHLVGVIASRRADANDVAGALALITDEMRAWQDLSRGHVPIITTAIAQGARSTVLDYAFPIVERADTATANEIAATIDILLATEPRFGDELAAEREWLGLHLGLPRLKPKDWPLPGGDELDADRGTGSRADRNEGAHSLELAEQLAALDRKACPETATLRACHEGMVGYMFAYPSLAGGAGNMFAPYVAAAARTVAHLAALRIAVEVRRQARCPTAEELASPRYTALLDPPVLGDRLRATRDGSTLRLAPPEWADKKNLTWTFQCP